MNPTLAHSLTLEIAEILGLDVDDCDDIEERIDEEVSAICDDLEIDRLKARWRQLAGGDYETLASEQARRVALAHDATPDQLERRAAQAVAAASAAAQHLPDADDLLRVLDAVDEVCALPLPLDGAAIASILAEAERLGLASYPSELRTHDGWEMTLRASGADLYVWYEDEHVVPRDWGWAWRRRDADTYETDDEGREWRVDGHEDSDDLDSLDELCGLLGWPDWMPMPHRLGLRDESERDEALIMIASVHQRPDDLGRWPLCDLLAKVVWTDAAAGSLDGLAAAARQELQLGLDQASDLDDLAAVIERRSELAGAIMRSASAGQPHGLTDSEVEIDLCGLTTWGEDLPSDRLDRALSWDAERVLIEIDDPPRCEIVTRAWLLGDEDVEV